MHGHRYPEIIGSALLSVLGLTVPVVGSTGEPDRPPNIILVMTDDLGLAELGTGSTKIATPNIDRLRDRGMLMVNGYSGSTVCAQPLHAPHRSAHRHGRRSVTTARRRTSPAIPAARYRGDLRVEGAADARWMVGRPAGPRARDRDDRDGAPGAGATRPTWPASGAWAGRSSAACRPITASTASSATSASGMRTTSIPRTSSRTGRSSSSRATIGGSSGSSTPRTS